MTWIRYLLFTGKKITLCKLLPFVLPHLVELLFRVLHLAERKKKKQTLVLFFFSFLPSRVNIISKFVYPVLTTGCVSIYGEALRGFFFVGEGSGYHLIQQRRLDVRRVKPRVHVCLTHRQRGELRKVKGKPIFSLFQTDAVSIYNSMGGHIYQKRRGSSSCSLFTATAAAAEAAYWNRPDLLYFQCLVFLYHFTSFFLSLSLSLSLCPSKTNL